MPVAQAFTDAATVIVTALSPAASKISTPIVSIVMYIHLQQVGVWKEWLSCCMTYRKIEIQSFAMDGANFVLANECILANTVTLST